MSDMVRDGSTVEKKFRRSAAELQVSITSDGFALIHDLVGDGDAGHLLSLVAEARAWLKSQGVAKVHVHITPDKERLALLYMKRFGMRVSCLMLEGDV